MPARTQVRSTRDALVLLEVISRAWVRAPERELMVPTMLETLIKAVGADDASVLLVDESGTELVEQVMAGRRRRPAQRIQIQKQGITGRVASSRKPAILGDVRKVKHYVPTSTAIQSEAAWPIVGEGRLIGVLNLESESRGFFKASDAKWLGPVAGQFALALTSEEAREHEVRWAAHFGMLFNLARLAYGLLEPKAFLERTVDMVRRHLDCSYAAIFRGDYAQEIVYLLAHVTTEQLGSKAAQKLKFGQGLIGTAFKLGETVHVRDVTKESMYVPAVENTKAELCVPIRIGDKCLGILDVQAKQVNAFGPDEVMLLETLARFLVPTLQALK